jgi:hypothetical protein
MIYHEKTQDLTWKRGLLVPKAVATVSLFLIYGLVISNTLA